MGRIGIAVDKKKEQGREDLLLWITNFEPVYPARTRSGLMGQTVSPAHGGSADPARPHDR